MSLFGTLINQYRTRLKLSQYEVGAKSGVPPHRIGKMEHGGNCTLKTAYKVAKALGIENIPVE